MQENDIGSMAANALFARFWCTANMKVAVNRAHCSESSLIQ
jgi:hypothetical protein